MLKIFRTNQLSVCFLFLVLILLLRSPQYFAPQLRVAVPEAGGYFTQLIWAEASGSFWFVETLLVLSIFTQAVLLTLIAINHRMSREINLFPGYVFVLVCTSSPLFLIPNGVILANTFFILAIWESLKIYRLPSCADSIFNIGLWLALASLFYFSFVVLLIWGILGLNMMRAFKLKELLTVIAGFLCIYVIAATIFYIDNGYESFVKGQFYHSVGFFDFKIATKREDFLTLGFMAGLILLVIGSVNQYMMKQNVQVQKKISVLFLALLFTAITIGVQGKTSAAHLLVTAAPMGLMLSNNFTNLPPKWAESVNLLWWVWIIVFQILPLLF